MKTLLILTAAALMFSSVAGANTDGQAAQASEATPAPVQMTVREHRKAKRLELQKERLEARRKAIKEKIEARAMK